MLIGRLGQDPELKYTQNGNAVTNFSMATDEGYFDKNTQQRVERTEWHRVVVWGRQAETVANYLAKGRLCYVEGRLQTRKWQDQSGQDRWTTEIVATNVTFLDSRGAEEGGYQQQGAPRGQQRGPGGQQQRGRPQQQQQQQPPQQGWGNQGGPGYEDEDMGPAFPSEASGMDDVPF
jgi:single-strand DNA-binding protein